MTLLVLERVDASHQRKLFTLFGVDYFASRYAWVNPIIMSAAGIVIAHLFAPADGLLAELLVGIGYGFLIICGSFCHGLGHILSSVFIKAPMQSIVFTATVNLTLYDETQKHPSRVHMGRALGGPGLNLILGLAALGLHLTIISNHFILFFGCVNLLLTAIPMLPIPSLDGAVVLRELRSWH